MGRLLAAVKPRAQPANLQRGAIAHPGGSYSLEYISWNTCDQDCLAH